MLNKSIKDLEEAMLAMVVEIEATQICHDNCHNQLLVTIDTHHESLQIVMITILEKLT